MQELPIVQAEPTTETRVKKPNWLRVKLPTGEGYRHVRNLVDTHKLHTIAYRVGQPLPGALEFARKVAKLADIVIFTGRCSEEAGADSEFMQTLNAGQMRVRVIDWLEKHGFPFADVYVGQGKPRVNAFIDDRAVVCSPQYDKDAYRDAEKDLRALLKRKPLKASVREPKFNLHRGKVE